MASPLVDRLAQLATSTRTAVEDEGGRTSFVALTEEALRMRSALLLDPRRPAGASPFTLDGERIMLLVSPGAAWVAAFLGIVLAGGTALPLSPLYPPAELSYFAHDAGAERLVLSDDLAAIAASIAEGRAVIRIADLARSASSAESAALDLEADAPALLLYTSGTTGKPKGALLTHANLALQAELLRAAWGFSEDDTLLHALPLHHLHGVSISLLTSLLAGSATKMLPRFDAPRVAAEIASRSVTALMAVPTMYQRLFELVDRGGAHEGFAVGARTLRLATSGSAALPVTLAGRWRELTGTIPLERFGMTEIGVGMSNPLDPAGRRPGWVGLPLPTVEAQISDDAGNVVTWASGPTTPKGDGAPARPGSTAVARGELWIRGPSVFKGYLGREDATASAFRDGWFRTGDFAERSEDGYFRLLGRTSVDILKSGGYKLSALEIEEALREHAAIAEVAVVGVPDEAWGERVVAVIVPAPGRADECATEPLRAWAKERLAPYKVPRESLLVRSLPRNALGKVVKPEILKGIAQGTLRG